MLHSISVQMEAGKLNLIIGPNGAGKSTLIKILSGQIRQTAGRLCYGATSIADISTAALARMRAVLSQTLELSFPLKVWEVVMMGRYPHFTGKPEEKDEKACSEVMQLFNITDMAQRDFTTLSGGERQRVHFARVLAQIWYPKPGQNRYLLLDEPLTFLDVHYQYQFMEQVKELLRQPDFVVVGVVHDLNLAARFADNLILLNKGEILAQGAPMEVLTTEHIKQAFQLQTTLLQHEGKIYLLY